MSELFKIPPLNWFQSNPWAKVGNIYTGSVGAESISDNAFLYRIAFYRKEDGDILTAECYDSISQLDKNITEYENKDFEGSENGRADLIEWLEFMYNEFKKSPEYNKKINYR